MNSHITTEEFIKEVKALGYGIVEDDAQIEVKFQDANRPLAAVHKGYLMELDTSYPSWQKVNDIETKTKLYNLLDRYARTPLDKREPEKKYRLRLDIDDKINIFDGNYRYLTKNDDYYCLSLSHLSGFWEDYQNTFTQAEIDAMGDITKGFVKEEICEK
jgi:hypothetical protein|nr:MAG TPA: hypothetical protein [Caudoviricetes sp.]